MINKFFLIFFSLFCNKIFTEGFTDSTLVHTKDGYKQIQQLKENDLITTYSFKNKTILDSKVIKIQKKHYNKCFKLIINGKEIISAPDQKFFIPLRKGCWLKIQNIKKNDFILRNIQNLLRIEDIVELKQSAYFYCLSVEGNHNYFVSEENVFVHNEMASILSFSVAFGSGTGPTGVAVGFCVGGLICLGMSTIKWLVSRTKDDDRKKCNEFNNIKYEKELVEWLKKNRNNFNPDPDKDPNLSDNVKKALKNSIAGGLSNVAANYLAEHLGFKRVKDVPFKNHGKNVFLKDNTYISADRDGHNGGIWKMWKRGIKERIGTYNWNLTKFVKR